MEWLIQLFSNTEVQNFIAEFVATKTIEGTMKAAKNKVIGSGSNEKSIEWQLGNCLQSALGATANDLGWEEDANAISETFITELSKFHDNFSREELREIFQKAVGNPVEEEDIECFTENFLKQLSQKCHEELREYLKMRSLLLERLIKDEKKNDFEPLYILTPNAKRWKAKHILGRDTFVSELCEKLSKEKPKIQLSGMGGIGKTEILNRIYVYFADNKAEHDFDHVALINYDGNMDSNLVQQLECTGEKTAENAWRFLHRLCDKKSVLLLIDDIRPKQEKKDDSGVKDESFSKLFTLDATVVYASRVKNSKFDNEKVDFLPTEVCIEIFQKQRYDEENKTIPKLTEKEKVILKNVIENRAGNNTLVVNRLGVIIKQHRYSSISQLEESLAKMNFDISIYDEDEYEYEGKFQEQLNKLYNLQDITKSSEKNILEAFALFPAIPLEKEVCLKWLHEDSKLDEDGCSLTLNSLSERTWLIRHNYECGTSYSMHQIVRASAFSQSSIKIEGHTGLITQCGDAISQEITDTFLKVQPYIPYAKALAEYFEKEDSADMAYIMSWIGRYSKDIASYDEAIMCYQKALAIYEKVFGLEHLSTASVCNNIAVVYRVKGEYEKALELFKKILDIREKVLGLEHQDTATTYNNIARVYKEQGKYKKALEYYKKTLDIFELLGLEHPDTAMTYNNMAEVYGAQGEYTKALELHEKSLTICEKVLGLEHHYTITAYNNIAGVYQAKGEYEKALEYYKKALGIVEKVLGMEHHYTATTYNNIAGVYISQGEYEKALEGYGKALTIYKNVLGLEHPSIATIYNNVAELYRAKGEYGKALEWYKKALSIYEKALGAEHPDTATIYNNMALAYYEQKEYDIALDWFRKAYYIRIKRLGAEHSYTKGTFNGMYKAYIKSGRKEEDFERWLGIESVVESQQQIAASIEKPDNKEKPTILDRVDK